ncbi:ribonucleoside triphosphate reductase [Candidatus Pacearchaeota archaeon]|nr:MAG: ribonucleoside triphosphate reductase [Candidatus Pacearchaeota archaeon]
MNTIIEYLDKRNWDIKENANQIFCSGQMISYVAGKLIKEYWFNEVYPKEAKELHEKGDIYCHDVSNKLTAYCSAFSTESIIRNGLLNPSARIRSSPPKHLSSAVNQLANFIGIVSQELSGAVGLNDFSLFLAPFVYYDKLTEKEVKQELQEFIYHINQPNRFSEPAFSNITISTIVPSDLKDKKVIIGGEEKSKTYKEFEKEMNMINGLILDLLTEGDADGRPMTFPVLTVQILPDFDWDSEIAKKIFQVTAKYGLPSFENFNEGTGRNPEQTRSFCCRLNLRLDDLKNHTGGLFGNSDNVGSIGVVDINLNRIGYLAKDEDEFFKLLDIRLEVSKKILLARRAKIEEMFSEGLYPYLKLYLPSFKTFFNTISVIGGNECVLNFLGKSLIEPESVEFMNKMLDYIVKKCEDFYKETGQLFNLEAAPGEGCSYSLAKKDKELYPDIIVSGTDEPFLTNSTQAPVTEPNFLKVINTQEQLQTKYTGGTIQNIYLGEKLVDYRQAKRMVKNIIEHTKLPYFSITPTYSICPVCGYITGEPEKCPTCERQVETFSRVVGYLRPKRSFNKGKVEEFKKRKYFDVSEISELKK